MSGDSCIHQLISITQEIYASFDGNSSLEVTGVFIYNIKCMGVKGDLLALIESFFNSKDNKELF